MDLYKVNYSYVNKKGEKVHGWEVTRASNSQEAEEKFLCNYPKTAEATAYAHLYTGL